MSSFYISPQVIVTETDNTTTTVAITTNVAGLVLKNTWKGPEGVITTINSYDEIISTFGYPIASDNACVYTTLAAQGFFLESANTGSLLVTRVMPSGATFAGSSISANTSTSACTFTADTSATSLTLSNIPNRDIESFAEYTLANANIFAKIIANSRGAWGNQVRYAIIDKVYYDKAKLDDVSVTSDAIYPFVKAIDSPLELNSDFLVIVQICDQGNDTTNSANWYNKEVYNVSTLSSAIDDLGEYRFAETKINSNSKFIKIKLGEAFINTSIGTYITTTSFQTLGGGVNNKGDSLTDGQIELAWDLFANAEELDVNTLIDAGSSETVKAYLDTIASNTRKDCMAVLDCPKAIVLNNKGNEALQLRAWRTATGSYIASGNNLNSSYSAVYGNWGERYCPYNNKYFWIPVSGDVAGVYSKTDYSSGVNYAPAGLNRGVLNGFRRLAWNPTKAERDTIFKVGINPIVSFAGQGKVIFGDKTMLDKASVFNNIGVRKLFISLEKAISTAAKYFIFEPNDPIERLKMRNMIIPYLQDAETSRGIKAWKVVIDDTNNTEVQEKDQMMVGDIFIWPILSTRFVKLNFIATNDSVSFNEG